MPSYTPAQFAAGGGQTTQPQTTDFSPLQSFMASNKIGASVPPQQTQQTQSNSPFNPNTPNSSFVNPNAKVGALKSALETINNFVQSLPAASTQTLDAPVQLLNDAGTRIAQAGVQTYNEFQNTGYDTPDAPLGTKLNGGKVAPVSTPTNTSNSENKVLNNSQSISLGNNKITTDPQQQGTAGALQIANQAATAAGGIGEVASAPEVSEAISEGVDRAGSAIKSGLENITQKPYETQAIADAMGADGKATSDMTYVDKNGQKVSTPITPKEQAIMKSEPTIIPKATEGNSQIHLDPNMDTTSGTPKNTGTQLSREDFIKGHPQAQETFDNLKNGKIANPDETPKGTTTASGKTVNLSDEDSKLLDQTRANMTPKQQAEAYGRGRGSYEGTTQKATIAPTDKDIEVMHEAQKAGVTSSDDPFAKIDKIHSALDDSEDRVQANADDSKAITNRNELKGRLAQIDHPISDTPESTYKKMDDTLLKIADNNDKTVKGLIQTRRDFDDVYFDKSNPSVVEYQRNVRNMLNDLISEKDPTGSYKSEMKTQSNLINARDNIAANAAKDSPKGSTAISRYINQHSQLKFLGRFLERHALSTALTATGATAAIGYALGKRK